MTNESKENLTQTKFSRSARLVALVFAILLVAFAAVAAAVSINNNNKTLAANTGDKDEKQLIKEVDESPIVSLNIKEDSDTPLKIISAKVYEVSKSAYQQLTGKEAEGSSVLSIPEVEVMNVSNKNISTIIYTTMDLASNRSKGLVIRGLKIPPGETYKITRDKFIKKETETTTDKNGVTKTETKADQRTDRYWLPFADKSQLQASVGVVFEDGSEWENKKGGENN